MEKYNKIIQKINEKEANSFINNTNSQYNEKTLEKNSSFDLRWLEKFEEILPYIDNIVRNPRKFIVPEEITIIEKTKKINEDSIKHLAKNSNLVREIDDDGFVKPAKLLNVFKEETFDLYENRFMNTLVNRLYDFIQRVLSSESYESFSDLKTEVNYNGETKINGEKVKIKLNIELDKKENKNNKFTEMTDVIQRIEGLKESIYGFISSEFIKGLSQALPVKSPIRKTNVFLKEPNFKKALELWEFLDMYDEVDLKCEVENKKENNNQNMKDNFDFLYYISYNMFRPAEKENFNKFEAKVEEEGSVYKFIENYILENSGTEKELKKYIENQYRIVINRKKKSDKEIHSAFRKIIQKYNRRKRMALK